MYLSKIVLDKKYAARPYQWHRVLWTLFPERPDAQRDFLFRMESRSPKGDALFLMQSTILPHSSADAEVMAAKAFSPRLSEGMPLRFKLRANPVKTIRDAGGRLNGKGEIKHCRVPLIDPDQQIAWLQRKLATAAELTDVIAVAEPPLWFSKKGTGSGKISPILFEGALLLKDAQQLNGLLKEGIGAAKSFGCGMLSIG